MPNWLILLIVLTQEVKVILRFRTQHNVYQMFDRHTGKVPLEPPNIVARGVEAIHLPRLEADIWPLVEAGEVRKCAEIADRDDIVRVNALNCQLKALMVASK